MRKTWWTVLYLVGWAIVGRLMLAVPFLLAVLAVFAPLSAHASDIIGEETVGEFRAWGDALQVGYVAGARSYVAFVGMRCPTQVTNAEYVAALKWNKSGLPDSMLLSEAVLRLQIRDGCKMHEPNKPSKPGMQS